MRHRLCLQAPMYDAMSSVIKAGCKAAVWVAKRV